jgi:hypothetical protein
MSTGIQFDNTTKRYVVDCDRRVKDRECIPTTASKLKLYDKYLRRLYKILDNLKSGQISRLRNTKQSIMKLNYTLKLKKMPDQVMSVYKEVVAAYQDLHKKMTNQKDARFDNPTYNKWINLRKKYSRVYSHSNNNSVKEINGNISISNVIT